MGAGDEAATGAGSFNTDAYGAAGAAGHGDELPGMDAFAAGGVGRGMGRGARGGGLAATREEGGEGARSKADKGEMYDSDGILIESDEDEGEGRWEGVLVYVVVQGVSVVW